MYPVEDAMIKQITAERHLKSLEDVKTAGEIASFLRGRDAEIAEWSTSPDYYLLLDYLAIRKAKWRRLIGVVRRLAIILLLYVILMFFLGVGIFIHENLLQANNIRISGWVVFACVLPCWFVASYFAGTRAERWDKRRLIEMQEAAKAALIQEMTPFDFFFEQMLKMAGDDLLQCEASVKKASDYGGGAKSCGTCKRVVSLNRYAGQSCPYCGAYWDVMEKHAI